MKKWKEMSRRQIIFAAALFSVFIIKYNYLLLNIFLVPSLPGLIIKNIFLFLFFLLIVVPEFRSNKGQKIVFIVYSVFMVYFFANIWYNRYFGNYLSLSDILMGRGIRPFKVLLWQIARPTDVLFVLDYILFLFLCRQGKKQFSSAKDVPVYRPGTVPVAILLFVFSIQVLINNALTLGQQNPVSLFKQSTSAFVNVYGFLPLFFVEFITMHHVPEKESPSMDPPKPLINEENYSDERVRRVTNIILIQVESLDQKVIDLSYNGKEITPFLNKLKRESLYFDNFYAQHVNGSFDAEFSNLTSMYPINKNFGFKVNDLTAFNSLVAILNEEGFNSLAFHGNDKTFFHRHKAFPELGFNRFYSREDFSAEYNVMDMEDFIFGINDFDFFLQSFNFLIQEEQPFFAFFITASSHTPFDFYPEDQEVPEFEDIKAPIVRNYFNSIHFVDKSLEMFFFKLREADLFDKSLIIIYADHESGIDKPEYSSRKDFDIPANIKTPENIPLIISHPRIDPGVRHREGSPTDIAPTILDLLGLDRRPEDFLGTSLMQDEDSPVIFLHETPQILYKGNLFLRTPAGLSYAGRSPDTTKIEIEELNVNRINSIIDFVHGITLIRRAVP